MENVERKNLVGNMIVMVFVEKIMITMIAKPWLNTISQIVAICPNAKRNAQKKYLPLNFFAGKIYIPFCECLSPGSDCCRGASHNPDT